MADPKVSASVKLKARRQFDRLLGLPAPERFEHSGPGGGPIEHKTDAVSRVRQIMADPETAEAAVNLSKLMERRGTIVDVSGNGQAARSNGQSNGQV